MEKLTEHLGVGTQLKTFIVGIRFTTFIKNKLPLTAVTSNAGTNTP